MMPVCCNGFGRALCSFRASQSLGRSHQLQRPRMDIRFRRPLLSATLCHRRGGQIGLRGCPPGSFFNVFQNEARVGRLGLVFHRFQLDVKAITDLTAVSLASDQKCTGFLWRLSLDAPFFQACYRHGRVEGFERELFPFRS